MLDQLRSDELKSVTALVKALSSVIGPVSKITLTRELKQLIDNGLVERKGGGRSTAYRLSEAHSFQRPINIDEYFSREIDQRAINENFNFDIFRKLEENALFTEKELNHLTKLQNEFLIQKSKLTPIILLKEFERVTIELSWKSSAIEGNTYSLLETEALIRDGIEAKGKKKEETQMILNHKEALQFVMDNLDELKVLKPSIIEHIHSTLIKNLGVAKNLRQTLVGIIGTNYKPLDNQFQIQEALQETCSLINKLSGVFEKALVALLMISYIQPFEDGNKRTSRILANGILFSFNGFPLSFRSVDISLYKKAMLIFYEANNIFLIKQIFIEQAEFAVKNYFRSSITK
ncbi:MAG: hypothetical protein A3F16_00445 [Deltaproteobacteria bacterium RIFCSPHIGHO2_12_FULL_43_9]|nr:MAG: hypothetical protein A3F16_00445 [Deltaproteobacteria bacterium RIFCSPHIGHO2_12_FULL_43_9]